MENIYFATVGLMGLITLIKFKWDKYFVFFFLVFFYGFFHFILGSALDYYKIFLFLYAFLLFSKYINKRNDKQDKYINLMFVLFSLSFWFSFYLNPFSIISALSQFLLQYFTPLLIYHWYKKLCNNFIFQRKYLKWVIYLIITQVGFSILKVFIIGLREATVGTIDAASGQLGVVIPIAALLFYWHYKYGRFTKKDWIIVISFLFIGIASTKRTPVFLYPVFLFLLMVWVPKKKMIMPRILRYAPIVLVLLYIGIRVTPTLNPENKVWGSFDPDFAIDYAMGYQFSIEGGGRSSDLIDSYGASAVAIFKSSTYQNRSINEVLFGSGIYKYRFLDEEDFNKYEAPEIGVLGLGFLSAAFKEFRMLGIIGFLTFLILNIMIILQAKGRIRWVILFFYLYIYFLYTSNIFTQPAVLLIILPVIFQAQNAYNKKLEKANTG